MLRVVRLQAHDRRPCMQRRVAAAGSSGQPVCRGDKLIMTSAACRFYARVIDHDHAHDRAPNPVLLAQARPQSGFPSPSRHFGGAQAVHASVGAALRFLAVA